MSEDELKQPGTRIDARLWERFRQDVQERRGGIQGVLRAELENAIENYLDASKGGDNHDRLRRIENNVETLADTMEQLFDELEAKNKKDSEVGSRTKKKLNRIKDYIEREAAGSDTVHESVVNNAIEDIAGSSQPTLKRYKEQLKQRHIAFERPEKTSKTWVLDEEVFLTMVRQATPEYEEDVIQEYGREWYQSVVDNLAEERTPGFQ